VLFWRAGVAVAAHPNRGRGAAALARSGLEPDVYLLDDGFQHRAIRRDWDLVLVTPRELASARKAFPAGPLRESWSALARADRIAITDVAPGEVAALATRANAELGLPTGAPPLMVGRVWGDLVELTRWQTVGDPGSDGMDPALGGGPARGSRAEGQAELNREPDSFIAFSGIANPSSFERLLLERGLDVRTHVIFPDHHRFAVRDLRRLARLAADGAALLTTEKDAARLPPAAFPAGLCWVGRTRLVLWRGEAELAAELERVACGRTT
jgi:tetraacyldisaccharide 4'-kinase